MQLSTKKNLLVLFLFFHTFIRAQDWMVEYAAGYGTYNLKDIKELQQSMVNNLGLKITDAFPGYVTHTVSFGSVIDNSYSGGEFTYLTTGGRLHRADYSGSYTVDMIMNGYRFGAFYRSFMLSKSTPVNVYWQLSAGIIRTNLRIVETMKVYTETADKTSMLSGSALYLEPSLGATYRLNKYLELFAGGGYEADMAGNMFFEGQKTEIRTDWSGLRLYGGLILLIP